MNNKEQIIIDSAIISSCVSMQEDKIKRLRKKLALEIELTASYRKALEEIEGIVKDWYKNEWSCYMCHKNMDKKLEDILNIIDKAKEN